MARITDWEDKYFFFLLGLTILLVNTHPSPALPRGVLEFLQIGNCMLSAYLILFMPSTYMYFPSPKFFCPYIFVNTQYSK
jgi:hypothetical protein